jgi:hypothetical protein
MDPSSNSKLPEQLPPTPDAMPITQPFAFASRNMLVAAALVAALLLAFGKFIQSR